MRILKYLKNYKIHTISIVALITVQAFCLVFIPLISSDLINLASLHYAQGFIETNLLYEKLLLMIVLSIILSASMFGQNSLVIWVSSHISREIGEKFISAICNFNDNLIDKSSIISRFTNDKLVIEEMIKIILQCVSSPILIILGLYFAYITAPSLLWIVALAFVLVLVAAVIVYKLLLPIYSKMQYYYDNVVRDIRQIISGMYNIRLFNKQTYENSQFQKSNKKLYKTILFTSRFNAVVNPLLILGYNMLAIIILLFGGLSLGINGLQIGNIIAFTSYCFLIIDSFVQIGNLFGNLPRANIANIRLNHIVTTTQNTDIKSSKLLLQITNLCESRNVQVIGPSGSGKTKLAKKMLIELKDDIDLGYCPQIPKLYIGSILSNLDLALGDDNLVDDEVYYKALKIACCEDFVPLNKQGLSKAIMQNGNNLSGGQKQRICIARAVIDNPDVVVFDDCFGALDSVTKEKIFANLKNDTSIRKIVYFASQPEDSLGSGVIGIDKIECRQNK